MAADFPGGYPSSPAFGLANAGCNRKASLCCGWRCCPAEGRRLTRMNTAGRDGPAPQRPNDNPFAARMRCRPERRRLDPQKGTDTNPGPTNPGTSNPGPTNAGPDDGGSTRGSPLARRGYGDVSGNLEAGTGIEPVSTDLQSAAYPACPPAFMAQSVGFSARRVKGLSGVFRAVSDACKDHGASGPHVGKAPAGRPLAQAPLRLAESGTKGHRRDGRAGEASTQGRICGFFRQRKVKRNFRKEKRVAKDRLFRIFAVDAPKRPP